MVQVEQAVEDFDTCRIRDRETLALRRLTKTMTEIDVIPAIGNRNAPIHRYVQLSHTHYGQTGFLGAIKPIVCRSKPLIALEHDRGSFFEIDLSRIF
jgi:hypothetical protein